MIYLASPYSDPDPEVVQRRYNDVVLKAGELMKKGTHVFSPIVHCHPIAMAVGLPTDYEYWKKYDEEMIAACDRVCVFCLPGWKESKGVQAELKIARNLGLEITYTYILRG